MGIWAAMLGSLAVYGALPFVINRPPVDAAPVALWALAESVGVYGLVLFMLFGKPLHLYAFLLASAALLLVHAPRVAPLRSASSSDLADPAIKIG